MTDESHVEKIGKFSSYFFCEIVPFQLIFTRDTEVKWTDFSFRHQNKWVNINFWRYLCILHVCRLKLCFWLTDPDKAKEVYVIFVKKARQRYKCCKKRTCCFNFSRVSGSTSVGGTLDKASGESPSRDISVSLMGSSSPPDDWKT